MAKAGAAAAVEPVAPEEEEDAEAAAQRAEEERLAAEAAAMAADGVDLSIEDRQIAGLRAGIDDEQVTLRPEQLLMPQDIVQHVHRDIAIRHGIIPEHDNLLAASKPEAPNYLRSTAANMTRMTQRNIQPRLTEAQRTQISADIEERNRQRPPMPKVLNAEERARNREVIKKMQTKIEFLKNPRFTADPTLAEKGTPCPFRITPEMVTFRNYDVGGVYEVQVELRNITGVGRHVRVMPCKNAVFAHSPLKYDGESGITPSSVIAPGMGARFQVKFAPDTLNDKDDELLIRTEIGDYTLPVFARRIQPQLEFEQPVHIGSILAGQYATRTMTISNQGGEGSFRIIPAYDTEDTEEPEHTYETDHNTGLTTFISPNFRIEPATFYLEVDETRELNIRFSATSTGQFQYPLRIEGDNGEKVPLTLLAISDAVRLEMLRWPTVPKTIIPRSPDPHESPWSLVPWQLSWCQPGAQVGGSESQAIEIANGGYLPMSVQWCLVEPPKALVSRLSVGGSQRLSDNIMKDMHTWPAHDPSKHGFESCPFTVSPATATLPPFSKASFTFAFYAYAPVSRCACVFAYLAVKELPASRHCLLHYNPLLQMQQTMQASGYVKGLPLFGGAVTPLVDTDPSNDEPKPLDRMTSTCIVTAVCLQGRSTAPKVTCLPPLVALSGDVLPFVAHEREIILRNAGNMPACFSFRLTSRTDRSSMCAELYDPIWIVGAHEVAPREQPNLQHIKPDSTDPAQRLVVAAEQLATQWPPLPPAGGTAASAMLPGYGAFATIAIEPHQGRIMPGQFVKIHVTIRIAEESNIDANILVDLPANLDDVSSSVVPPLKVRVLAAARAPRVEIRGTSFLDFGVVRTHARQTLKLRLDNPSDMPTLVRLRHRPEEKKDEKKVPLAHQLRPDGPPTARSVLGDAPRMTPRPGRAASKSGPAAPAIEEQHPDELVSFPTGSHQDVVTMFVNAIRRGSMQGAVPIEDTYEVPVQPWVNARSGCWDASGRRRHQFTQGRGHQGIPEDGPEDVGNDEGVGDDVDFIFNPECVALWPQQSTEVDVTLRTHFQDKYRALVEVIAFDSDHTQCIEAVAEVQLPHLRMSTQHAHFPVSYVKTATQPFTLELFNDYDMPAAFHWNIPVKLEACIECQMEPMEGVVPPRSSVPLTLICVPTRESEYAHLLCQVFVKDVLQPLALEVSARVYGPEVDYAVVPEGMKPPVITHIPRGPEDPAGVTYQITCGTAEPGTPDFDFGTLELLKQKRMQLVLYNRTGIPTPFGIKVEKNPAWDPLSKGKKIGSLLEAATRMFSMASQAGNNGTMKPEEVQVHTFQNEPQPVAGGRQPSLDRNASGTKLAGTSKRSTLGRSKSGRRFNPKSRTQEKKEVRRWLLDDKHEGQAFRTDTGAAMVKEKEEKEQGMVALKSGRGYAVGVEPSSDWLQPFSKAIITCTCFSDVPGSLEDELVISIGQLQSHADGGDFRIPIRAESIGNPLFLPEQQVGLNSRLEIPRLLIETITPAAKSTIRTVKVGNSSMTQVHLTWKVMSRLQLEVLEQRQQSKNAALDGMSDAAPASGDVTDAAPTGDAAEAESADAEAAQEEGLPGEIVEDSAGAEAEAPAPAEAADAAGDVPEGSGDGERADGEEDQGDAEGAIEEGEGANMEGEEPGDVEVIEAADGSAQGDQDMDKAEPMDREMPHVEDPFALHTGEPPLKIEPVEAILPVQGYATFTVTMLASKATTTCEGHYQYRLLGEGRYSPQEPEAKNADPEMTQAPAVNGQGRTVARGVAELPEIELDQPELHDDDSDIEVIPAGKRGVDKTRKPEKIRAESKDGPKQGAVISTLTIDCIGDCIIPKLTVDKKGDPNTFEFADAGDADSKEHCPVFKFVHAAISQPLVAPSDKNRAVPGVKLGGKVGGMQNQGIAAAMTREVTLANENACNIYCRFRIEGPFRIKIVEQAGKKPVVPNLPDQTNKRLRHRRHDAVEADAMRQLFVVPSRCTISLLVEYMPHMVPASEWTHNVENVFRGDLIVEYPRDDTVPDAIVDLQRIHLHATSRKPAIRLDLIPFASLDPPAELPRADVPPWAELPPVLIEFGYVHVESAIAHRRAVLLSNESNVIARWRIFHVGRKRRPPHEIGVTVREDEDFRALDEREAFEFDISEGELQGPSNDALVPGATAVRMPRWCPIAPSLPKRLPHMDEDRFEPRRVNITFKPAKNEVYKCRFRVQVEEGRNVDFICRGTGSYDEEDDAMDYQEA